jgi:putative oxidoreductase
MLWSHLERYRDAGLLIARLGFGLGFVWYHGLPKLMGGMERMTGTGRAIENIGIGVAPEFFGVAAALAETLGGLLLASGLFFRPAALAVAAVMFVATAMHINTGQGTPAHSFKNFWVLLGLFFIGPGRYSLDHVIEERRRRRAGVPAPPRRETPTRV